VNLSLAFQIVRAFANDIASLMLEEVSRTIT
jgi:hypothetical protein